LVQDVKENYTAFHVGHNPRYVYPSEWVVRTMLGSYPHLSLDRGNYQGAKILDVGFGDGRNWTLFHNVGLDIHGVEITEEIIALGRERALSLGMPVTLKIGTNASLPFASDFFDYILASSSWYYVDQGTTFADNLKEYHRVLKPGGTLMATLPEAGSSIFAGCIERGDAHVEIRNDPWGLRNGYVFRRFGSAQEIEETLSPYFDSFSLGLCHDDYYGVQINLFLLVCRKKSGATADAA